MAVLVEAPGLTPTCGASLLTNGFPRPARWSVRAGTAAIVVDRLRRHQADRPHPAAQTPSRSTRSQKALHEG